VKTFQRSIAVITSLSAIAQGSSARRRRTDFAFFAGAEDEERAQATLLGSGERPAEKHEPLLGERAHERRVVADRGWPATPCPSVHAGPASRITAK